jgi:PAS domain S-box-containing protein
VATDPTTHQLLREENAALRVRLEEAEEILRAIRTGEVDALVVESSAGSRVFTLQGVDAESNRFRGEILAQVSDAVIAVDGELHITYLNAAAERQYGVAASDVLGRRLTEVYEYRWLDPADEAAAATALRETGQWRGENVHIRRDGGVIGVESAVTRLPARNGGGPGLLAVIRDISERQRAGECLRESEERFRAIANSIPNFIWLADSTGGATWFNQGWLDYTGTRLEDNLGTGWKAVHHPDYLAAMAEKWERHLREGMDWEDTFPLRGKDGQYRWFLSRMKVIRDAAGRVVRFFGTNTDVTELRQAEEKIQALNRDLERRVAERVEELATKARLLSERNAEVELARHALEGKAAELALASKYKSEFLANMSHELRTPLNSILIFSNVLAENAPGNLTPKQVEFSQHIHSSGNDLLQLISEILDLAKIESGFIHVSVDRISIAGLRDAIERNFRHQAEAKGLRFQVTFAEDLPDAMDSDPHRLEQILKNLLSNAVKFTAHGRVDVRVGLATRGWSLDHPVLSQVPEVVAFVVKDTGLGIAPEKQRLIFEAFQQCDASTSRKYGGTGLGLAISSELAALLGGEIKLISAEGGGSTFTLYLPLHSPGAARPPHVPAPLPSGPRNRNGSTRPAAPDEALRHRNVLVVDDDPRNIYALVSLLENHEVHVLTATNGRSGIEIIKHTPDLHLVLMDIMMPELDGYDTIRQIRQSPELRNLPIIALTAKAMKGDREKCLEAGASDYIAKPVDTAQLLSLMRVWLRR